MLITSSGSTKRVRRRSRGRALLLVTQHGIDAGERHATMALFHLRLTHAVLPVFLPASRTVVDRNLVAAEFLTTLACPLAVNVIEYVLPRVKVDVSGMGLSNSSVGTARGAGFLALATRPEACKFRSAVSTTALAPNDTMSFTEMNAKGTFAGVA
jgi:hypothetical protein